MMFRSPEKILEEKEAKEKIARLPAYRRLKYIALAFISFGSLLMLVMLFWMKELPLTAILIMRGTAGLCALIFAIIVAIYVYKIQNAYFKQQNNRRTKSEINQD